jgi:AcrR family transcriptional regulator
MAEVGGDVRSRLIQVGVDLVSREGTGALSLREIARQAQVSHGAPRRYFPTHQALLAAIAREGYRQLSSQVAAVIYAEDRDPGAQLLALGRLYLDFARTNSGMFELMFRHDLLQGNQIGLREVSLELFGVLVDVVTRIRHESGSGPPPSVVAGALWANLHGIAQLSRWGSLQVALRAHDPEVLLRAALDAHVSPSRQSPSLA